MTTDYDFTAEVEAGELEDRRKAIEQIKDLYEWRETEKSVKAMLNGLDPSASDYGKMGALRRWLFDHDGESLFDDERGFKAWLQPMGETDIYDTPLAIKERQPELFQRLWELGCFQVDAARVKEAIKGGHLAAADVATFRHSVLRTPALKADKVAASA